MIEELKAHGLEDEHRSHLRMLHNALEIAMVAAGAIVENSRSRDERQLLRQSLSLPVDKMLREVHRLMDLLGDPETPSDGGSTCAST